MSEEEVQVALDHHSVELKQTSAEDRSYRVFLAPRERKFFVGVLAPGQVVSTAVTILEQAQYESDRSKLRAEVLRIAALKALGPDQFAEWASTFDWAAQRHSGQDLVIRARYRLPDGFEGEVQIPVSYRLPTEVLSGGRLKEALEIDAFLARVNVDFYRALGEGAPEAMAHLSALDMLYGPHVLLDMLAAGGPTLLSRFASRRIGRGSLRLFITFVHDQKLQQIQKTRPNLPSSFLFENMIPELAKNDMFLSGVIDLLRKLVPEQELLQSLSTITELQVWVNERCYDLLTDDDTIAVTRLLELYRA